MAQINHPGRLMQGVSYKLLLEQLALQKERHFLWLPIFLSLGIGTYFSLTSEPSLLLGAGLWALSIGLWAAFFPKRDDWRLFYIMSVIILMAVTGFFMAQMRSFSVHTPLLTKKLGPVTVEGSIQSLENLEEESGTRIVLRDLVIEDVPPEQTPRKVRLRLRYPEGIMVGQRIKVLAELNPPSGPVVPGGFDFRRHMYFAGIGAVGFIYKPPEILAQPQNIFTRGVEGLRQNIAERIKTALPTREASVTLALMIGQQNALGEPDMEAIRNAGLAHMLSISGLHISLVAGVLFFMSRLVMAGFPAFALQHPIKKYAAVIGMLGAIFYMLVAGSPAPTQRSVLMTGMIFLAIILDRSPISLRMVAFAALVVLLVAPENLVSVSFQMSFAAVTALIAFFEATRQFWMRWYRESGHFQKAGLYLSSVCLTTLIATIATTPFSIYHFQQFAFLGVIANFVAVPLLSFFMMPFIILGFFLMPFGVEGIALYPVGIGVDLILKISYWASSLPHSVMLFPAWPFASFILCILAGLWIILWKGWGKTVAILPLIASFILIMQNQLPHALVSETHKLFGFHNGKTLYVSTRKTDKFTLENWERYYGLKEGSAMLLPQEGSIENGFYTCDPGGCIFNIHNKKITYLIDPYELQRECQQSDAIFSVEPVDKNLCRATLIVDKFDSWRSGSQALWIRKDITLKSAAEITGQRPWSNIRKRTSD